VTGRVRPALAALVLAGALAAGCSDDASGGSAGCGPVQREPLDARSVHVLPSDQADDVTYETDPPTSGPHLPGPETEPVHDAPIPGPIQVGLLEEGAVILQHSGITADERAEVEGLAGDGVVVAPAEALPDDAAVVATAWVTKQVCGGVDLEALRAFAEDHADQGPGAHG
jgi:hypothetical protein